MKKVIILTGCSCSGKTTLFKKLSSIYDSSNVSECASTVINQWKDENKQLPWEVDKKDPSYENQVILFQHDLFNMQKFLFSKLNIKKNFFLFDRSFEDIVTYLLLYLDRGIWGWKDNTKCLTKEWLRNIDLMFSTFTEYYVFVLRPLDIFENNGVRNKTLANMRNKEYDMFKAVYSEAFGKSEVFVENELQSVEERVEWIKSIIGN